MTTIYSYACKDCQGMESCPGLFYANTREEVWQHMDLHARIAHEEDPTAWSAEDRDYLQGLIRAEVIQS